MISLERVVTDSAHEATIERAIAGDRQALTDLLNEYAPTLERQLRSEINTRWRSVLDAEDVLQVTFLEAFLRIQSFRYRGQGSCLAWLRRIARNNLLDAIRSLQAGKQLPPENRVSLGVGADSSWQLLELLGATSGTPSRQAVAKESENQLQQAISRLPRDYARVITLYDLEMNPVGKVAEIMERSKGAVFMLRARAIDLLRESFVDLPSP